MKIRHFVDVFDIFRRLLEVVDRKSQYRVVGLKALLQLALNMYVGLCIAFVTVLRRKTLLHETF